MRCLVLKFRLDKKYLHWGITGFLVLASAILFYYFLFHTDKFFGIIKSAFNVCMPIICGLIMAYLLTPICTFFERKILYPLYRAFHIDTEKVKTKKRIRILAILLTMFLTLYLLYIFFSIVLKEVVTSIQSIALQSSIYVSNLERLMENILASNKNIEKLVTDLINTYSDELDNWLNNSVLPRINVILKEVSLSVIGVAKGLWNLVIGLIISIYVLASKETFTGQAKKLTYALFPEESANGIISDFRYANKTFGSYISGKIIDSIIIGILCYIFMRIFSLPYEILVSVIVGVTNIIPFFGPFLGGIPSALLIIMVNPISGLKFIILILILQQFDGNILGPKILGDSTGLSSFWVIFSITIFGAYFGVLGMAIGVPVFALIYAAIKRKLNATLKSKGLTTDTKEYMHLDKIEGHQMIQMTEEKRRDARKSANSPSISDRILKSLKNIKKSDTLHHDENSKG